MMDSSAFFNLYVSVVLHAFLSLDIANSDNNI